MFDWIFANQTLLFWLLVFSVVSFVAGAVAGPWWLIRLPADYFAHRRRRPRPVRGPWRIPLLIARNTLGTLLVFAGILMLVLPGQGVLTIVAGVLIMDFPSKYALARWIVQRPAVLHSINWMRSKAGKPHLVFDI